ncbi:rhomboid family protein [Aspergillus sclerotioniger CBS 115572]|uniref:Rhomboid family protein n=1 Tax=Aspergillus sclerotioniger CBS 115572 TaxID=1450535 RepID=A0A317W9N7_9EURO|nr:rhomboid family protein [Aspergillus sclerotioniger CBS 115572]PWY83306.1 rhomboid family protein [Aspergillus sclerotioniger CBS 115572]
MNNAFGVARRIPCPGLRASSWLLPVTSSPLRSAQRLSTPSALPWRPDSLSRRLLGSWSSPLLLASRSSKPSPGSLSIPVRSFNRSSSLRSRQAPPVEHGVSPRSQPFSAAELKSIFGARSKISPAMGNRALAVLHGRRLQGTLDLKLPADIHRSIPPHSLEAALVYLRTKYPMDEDAMILARVHREMDEEEAMDTNRYKPQSGSYGAELGQSNDPSGRSVLQDFREKNEAWLLAEQERKRQEWLQGGQHHDERLKRSLETNSLALQNVDEKTAMEIAPKDRQLADPRQRPVLAWVQKNYLAAQDLDLDISKLTMSRQLLPSLVFMFLTLGLCYAFTMYYEPPANADRMWPNIPRSAATTLAIMGINVGIFGLWWFPPAWRLLNRYFINVVANPNPPFRLVGSIFSHQYPMHLFTNMLCFAAIAPRLHDEIGRGEFLSLFLASGVVGSFSTVAVHCLQAQWTVTALGLSGALSGLLAAYCTLHADQNLQASFLPDDWKKVLSAPGWAIIATVVSIDILSLVLRRRLRNPPKIDHWCHLGGYFTGITWALYRSKEIERTPREANHWFTWRSFKG